MTTPEKISIEKKISNEIRQRLKKRKLTKLWLANALGMDYGKVKRILNDEHAQQLSITVADNMLIMLGSNLKDVISLYAIDELKKDVNKVFKKHRDIYKR